MDSKQAENSRRDGATRIGARLTALARRAEAVIVFERFWPPLVWAATLVALFLVVSWLGLWQALPRAARIGGVAAFAVAFVIVLAPLARLRRPVRAETLDRLDRDSGAPHRPAASLDDRLAMAGEDPDDRGAVGAAPRPARPPGRAIRSCRSRPGHGVARSARAAIRRSCWRRSPPRSSPGRSVTAGSPPPSTGATARARPRRRGSTRGSTRPLTPTSRRSCSTSPPTATRRRRSSRRKARRWWCAPTPTCSRRGSRAPSRRSPAAGRPTSPRPRPPRRRASAPAEKRWTIAGDGAVAFRRDGALASADTRSRRPRSPRRRSRCSSRPQANLSGSLTLHYSLADRYGVAERRGRVRQSGRQGPRRRARSCRRRS